MSSTISFIWKEQQNYGFIILSYSERVNGNSRVVKGNHAPQIELMICLTM